MVSSQLGWWNSSSLDIQDPPGQGAVQPAVGDPASGGGLEWVTHRGPFQPLIFCGSVIVILWRVSGEGGSVRPTPWMIKAFGNHGCHLEDFLLCDVWMKRFYALPTCLVQQKEAVGGPGGWGAGLMPCPPSRRLQQLEIGLRKGDGKLPLCHSWEQVSHRCFAERPCISCPQNQAGNADCSSFLGTPVTQGALGIVSGVT